MVPGAQVFLNPLQPKLSPSESTSSLGAADAEDSRDPSAGTPLCVTLEHGKLLGRLCPLSEETDPLPPHSLHPPPPPARPGHQELPPRLATCQKSVQLNRLPLTSTVRMDTVARRTVRSGHPTACRTDGLTQLFFQTECEDDASGKRSSSSFVSPAERNPAAPTLTPSPPLAPGHPGSSPFSSLQATWLVYSPHSFFQ